MTKIPLGRSQATARGLHLATPQAPPSVLGRRLRLAPDDLWGIGFRRRAEFSKLGLLRRGSLGGRFLGIDDLRSRSGSRWPSGAGRAGSAFAGSRSSAMMVRMEARISSIDGSYARWARRSASSSRSLEFDVAALIRPSSRLSGPLSNQGSSVAKANRSTPAWASDSRANSSLAVGSSQADPLALDLFEMDARIVLGDGKPQGRDIQYARSRTGANTN